MAPLTEIEFMALPGNWIQLRELPSSNLLVAFQLPNGVGFSEWALAAQATGRLRAKRTATGDRWCVVGEPSSLIDEAARVLDYFGEDPSSNEELQRVRARLHRWLGEDARRLSDYAVAFADVELRELLADEARSAADVWSEQVLAIDPRAAVQQIVQDLRELLDRSSELSLVPPLRSAEHQVAAGGGPLHEALRHPAGRTRNEREVG